MSCIAGGKCRGWDMIYIEGYMCRLCWLAKHPPTFIPGAGTPIPRVNNRPAHDVTPKQNNRQTAQEPARNRRWYDCVDLGPVLPIVQTCGCTEKLRACGTHGQCTTGITVTGVHCCATCDDHVAKRPPLPKQWKVGVAVGCYGWPNLAEVQIHLIRQHCGDVPILLCDDASPFAKEFLALEKKYPQVTYWSNVERLGHYAGDMSVFFKAVNWAVVNQFHYVAKISQRMLVDHANWLAKAIDNLYDCGSATLAAGCFDNGHDLYVRTELMLLDTEKWKTILPELDKTVLNNPTELGINHIAEVLLGGKQIWPGLTRVRYHAEPGYIWHCTHDRTEYQRIASRFGLTLDDAFHSGGSKTYAPPPEKAKEQEWLLWKRG